MPAVDLGPYGMRAEVGMHGEGEIHRRRPLRQLEQRTLGGKGEDAVLIDCQSCMLEQLFGIVGPVDDLDQVPQPADLPVGPVALLVSPVGSKAELVAAVHLACANLYLNPH